MLSYLIDEIILRKCPYHPKQPTYCHPFQDINGICYIIYETSKMHMEPQKTQKRQNNSEQNTIVSVTHPDFNQINIILAQNQIDTPMEHIRKPTCKTMHIC